MTTAAPARIATMIAALSATHSAELSLVVDSAFVGSMIGCAADSPYVNVHVPLIGCPSEEVTRHDARYVPAGWLRGQATVTTPRLAVGSGSGTDTPVFVCATTVAVPGIGACENVSCSSVGAFGLIDPSAGEADRS